MEQGRGSTSFRGFNAADQAKVYAGHVYNTYNYYGAQQPSNPAPQFADLSTEDAETPRRDEILSESDARAIVGDVVASVGATSESAESLYELVVQARNKSEEIESLETEASILQNVLLTLRRALVDDKSVASISRDSVLQSELSGFLEFLHECRAFTSAAWGLLSPWIAKSSPSPSFQTETEATKDQMVYTKDAAMRILNRLNAVKTSGDAREDSCNIPRATSTPSPLNVQIEELQRQSETLRKAARDGDTGIVQLLLDSNVSVDSKDRDGRTALSFAAENGNTEIIKILLKRGASTNSTCAPLVGPEGSQRDSSKLVENGRKPLHWAAIGGHYSAAKALLDGPRTDVDAVTTYNRRTPALEAAIAGHRRTIELMLEHGANVNARTYHGWTILHEAAHSGRLDIAEIAVSYNANVEAVYKSVWKGEDNNNRSKNHTPLHYAVWPHHRPNPNETSILELLLRNPKGTLSMQDSWGFTPIHYAVQARWRSALKLLLKHATMDDLEIKRNHGQTALDDARKSGDREMIDMINTTHQVRRR